MRPGDARDEFHTEDCRLLRRKRIDQEWVASRLEKGNEDRARPQRGHKGLVRPLDRDNDVGLRDGRVVDNNVRAGRFIVLVRKVRQVPRACLYDELTAGTSQPFDGLRNQRDPGFARDRFFRYTDLQISDFRVKLSNNGHRCQPVLSNSSTGPKPGYFTGKRADSL